MAEREEYGPAEHKAMVEDRVRQIDYFMVQCPCAVFAKKPTRDAAESWLIDHYKSEHRWSEGRPLLCGKDAGARPSWMSPDQYDPCQCRLPLGHEGGHQCKHDLPHTEGGPA